MKALNVHISDELHAKLHRHTHYKGDIIRIVTEALNDWMVKQDSDIAEQNRIIDEIRSKDSA